LAGCTGASKGTIKPKTRNKKIIDIPTENLRLDLYISKRLPTKVPVAFFSEAKLSSIATLVCNYLASHQIPD
jgi:hypothetical protein